MPNLSGLVQYKRTRQKMKFQIFRKGADFGIERNICFMIHLKNHRASLFNDDLSNEPNFGQIYFAGQFLCE
jgi:hypothetical protein